MPVGSSSGSGGIRPGAISPSGSPVVDVQPSRATDDRIDVSRIARAGGGGGHRRAAGFSTDLEFPELVSFLRAQLAEQL